MRWLAAVQGAVVNALYRPPFLLETPYELFVNDLPILSNNKFHKIVITGTALDSLNVLGH